MPLDEGGMQALKSIAVLTRMANESSEIPINLVKANKEAVDDLNKADAPKTFPTSISVVGIRPAAKNEL